MTTTMTMLIQAMVMNEDGKTMMTQNTGLKRATGTRSGNGLARRGLLALLLLTLLPTVWAETITIGKGTGIVWEGLPFNTGFNTGVTQSNMLNYRGLLSISTSTASCLPANQLTNIGGYLAFRIAPGVGIIPRTNISGSYNLSGQTTAETIAGTIGLPETRAVTSSGYIITNPFPDANYQWCISPRMTSVTGFFDASGRFVKILRFTGNWVLVADGSQRSAEVAMPPLYAASFEITTNNSRYTQIFPSAVTLRISNLACTVATTTAINFGNVERNTTTGSELASQTYPLTVSCSQDTDRINANINVQFRPISGLYNGNVRQLALNQGGGYITGEINNTVTGSGACNQNTGIPFDNTQLKVGAITSTEASKMFSNQVTWRLCSGGESLPLGPVTAAADMLVTFN